MVATTPERPDEILQQALAKIGLALSDANRQLVERGLQAYITVAGTLFFNDPAVHGRVPSMSVVLDPQDFDPGQEGGFRETEEFSTLAVFSAQKQAIVQTFSLRSTHLSTSAGTMPGMCCRPKWMVKRIPLPGGGANVCLEDDAC